MLAASQLAPGGGPATAAKAAAAADRERDQDGDSVPDRLDRCATRAGLLPDGCPPRDSDGDGVLDRLDRCAQAAGPMGNHGCPDTDQDADGVVDRADKCVEQKGEARFSGCPAPDRDMDGIADPEDRCPDEAEVWNNHRDTDGCPDSGAPLLRLVQSRNAVVEGKPFRSSGSLSRQGRKAMEAATQLARLADTRRLRVTITLAAGADLGADVVARRARAITRAVTKKLPALDVVVEEVRGDSDEYRVSLLFE